MTSFLNIDNVALAYDTDKGQHIVCEALNFTVDEGAIVCLLGESGCGKSTLLRAIAGFEPIRAGKISLNNQLLNANNAEVPPEKRRIGMMFQDYALFPHLNIAKNIAFGLRKQPKETQQKRVAEMLSLVGLSAEINAYPHELSGGQQQRIALARALAPAPDLLLLDEPLSNLDSKTREKLSGEMRDILKQTKHTALIVTHDLREALAMSDYLYDMQEGKITRRTN